MLDSILRRVKLPATRRDLKGNTQLHLVSRYILDSSNLKLLQFAESLVDADTDVNTINQDGETPLHKAVFHLNEMVGTFLSYGVIEQRDGIRNLNACLHFLGFLISNGANCTLLDHKGHTALQNLNQIIHVYYDPLINYNPQALLDYYNNGEMFKAKETVKEQWTKKLDADPRFVEFCALFS